MKKFFVAFLFSLVAVNARTQFCSNCIFNSAAPQQAQFNISSATIRGPLTVGSINISSITLSSATAGVFIGSGTNLTNLNASQLLLGTVPAARIAGAYSGVTGLGTVASGVWNGTVVGTQYGGTGENFSAAAQGALPVFTGVGTMGALAPPSATSVLMQNNVGTFFWTSSPTVSGENVGNIPLTNLQSGTLPYDITVATNSIPLVLGSSIQGNISGNATNITGNLSLSQLSAGTLPNNVPASSITVTGVQPGYYGGAGQAMLIHIQSDGRVASISQSTYSVSPSSITPGPLPSGVTIGAAQITSGTLAGNVIASSIAANGVTAGNYASTTQIPQLTVGVDGRLTLVTQSSIALPLSQLNSGTLGSGVLVPAANINAGRLGSQVIASSIAANGVIPGTYGSSTYVPFITVGVDGRITAISSATIPSASGAQTNVDNLWTAPQTYQSSVTVYSTLGASNLTATSGITGPGSGITNLTPANLQNGSLPNGVIASSIAANGVVAGEYGSTSYVPQVTVGGDGRITSISSAAISLSPTGPVGGDLTGSLPNPQVIKASNAAGLTVSYGLSAQNAVFGALPTVDTITTSGSLTMAPTAIITSSAGVISGGPMIDVRIYGAKCDGSTDDTSAIQAALNQFTNGNAGTSSGALLFPPTPCSITKTLYYGGSPSYAVRLVGTVGGSNGGTGSGLVWNGASGGTMMILLGASNFTSDDMEFNLNNSAKYGVVVTATNQINTTMNVAVASTGSHTVAPASIVNIATGTILNIDSGANFELVTVAGIAGSSFTATFAKTHSVGATVGNSAGSSGTLFRRNSFLNANGSGSAEVAAGNPFTIASNQISEVQFDHSNFFGGTGSVNGFLALSAGNAKNWAFYGGTFSGHQVHANLTNASGTMNFYGTIMSQSSVSDFTTGAAVLNIDGVESEPASGSSFVTGTTGAHPGQLTIKNSLWGGAASVANHDIIISYQGSVILLNNEFYNLRLSTTIPYVQIDDPLFTGTSDANILMSQGNWYQNASAGYAPFYDANENALLPSYYNNQPVNVTSIGDFGGPDGTLVKLNNYVPMSRVVSQTATYVASTGLVAAGTTDTAVAFRNNANTADVVGIGKNSSDVVLLGGSAGTLVSSMTSNGTITSGSSMTATSFFGDGSHLTGISVNFPNTTSSSFTVTNSLGIYAPNGPIQSGNTQINTTGLALGGNSNPAVQGVAASGNSVLQSCGSAGCFHKLYDSSGNLGLYVAPSLGFVGIGTTSPQYALHVSSGIVYVDGSNSGVKASTFTLSQNSAVANPYPHAPLTFTGNTNAYLQIAGQNLSNGLNASTDISLADDLGGDTSFYFNIGVNSSKFSQTGQSAEKSSSTYVTSSDSDLLLWAGTNGGLNGAQSENLIFGSSNPVSANIAAYILPATASGPGAFVALSSFTVTSSSGVLATSSVTASAFFGDGSHLTGISGTISGLTAGVVPVALTATTIGNGNGFITSGNSGVAITTTTTIGTANNGNGGLFVNIGANPGVSIQNFVELYAGGSTFGSQPGIVIATNTVGNVSTGGSISITGGETNAGGGVAGGALFIQGGNPSGNNATLGAINLGEAPGVPNIGLTQPINMYGNLNAPVGSTLTVGGSSTFGATSTTTFNGAVAAGAGMTGILQPHTRQIFTSGSGVYYSTTSTGVTPRQIWVRMVGGGGGGASAAANASSGTATNFGSVYAATGSSGTYDSTLVTNGAGCRGGLGGSGGSGSASLRIPGGPGCSVWSANFASSDGNSSGSGCGGNSQLGFGPESVQQNIATTGTSATANSGAGGSGGFTATSGVASCGGGGGEYVELLITSPSANYSYTVGAGGAGGNGTNPGGNGGSGIIIVDEYY